MARFRASFGRILTIGGLAAATGTATVYRSELADRAAAYAQNIDKSPVALVDDASKPPQTVWDNDWDRRSAFGDLTKAIRKRNVDSSDDSFSNLKLEKNSETSFENGDDNKDQNRKRGKATRHLIFVRHGQYNSGKKLDEDKKLTDLGRFVHATGSMSFGNLPSPMKLDSLLELESGLHEQLLTL